MNRVTLSLRLLATIAMFAALFLPMATVSCHGSPAQSVRQNLHEPAIWLLALWPIPLILFALRTHTQRLVFPVIEGVVCVLTYQFSEIATGVGIMFPALFGGEARAEIGWLVKDGGFALYFAAVAADFVRGIARRWRSRVPRPVNPRYTI